MTTAQVTAVRCRDVWGWQRAILSADLTVRRADGRTRVSHRVMQQVALALATHMDGPGRPDPGGGARPGADLLADRLGLSTSSVDHALAGLVQLGWLLVDVPGTRGRRAVYSAALPCGYPPESLGRDPDSSDKAWVGTQTIAGKPGSGPRPTNEDQNQPPPRVRARSRPQQPPLIAAVQGGRASADAPTPTPDDTPPAPPTSSTSPGRRALDALADAVERRHGPAKAQQLRTGRIVDDLAGVLARKLAGGAWTAAELAGDEQLTRDAGWLPGALLWRLAHEVADHGPAAAAAARRVDAARNFGARLAGQGLPREDLDGWLRNDYRDDPAAAEAFLDGYQQALEERWETG